MEPNPHPNPTESAADATIGSLVADVFRKARRRASLLVVVVVASALTDGASAALLFPLLRSVGVGGADAPSSVVDRVLSGVGLRATPTTLGLAVVVVAIARGAILLLQGWLNADLQHRYVATWRQLLLDSAVRAKWRFFVDVRGGDLANALIGETLRLSSAFFICVQLLITFSLVVVYVAIAVVASWQTSILLLAVGVLIAVLNRRIVRRSRAVGTQLSRQGEELQGLTGELIGGAKLIKATATEDVASQRFAVVVDRLRLLDRWSSFQPHLLQAVFETVAIIGIVGVLVIGTQTLSINAATLLIVLGLFLRLYPRLSSLQLYLQQLQVYLPALATCRTYLSRAQADEEVRGEGEELPEPLRGVPVALEVDDLTVRYGDVDVVRNVSIEVEAGSTVGIVGSSGAGKSTLVDAVLRLTDPASGRIRVSGLDLNALPLSAWRRSIGYVAQETFLFRGSIRENLEWGAPGCTEEELIDAANRAHAHDFVSKMPHRYDAIVGDRGVRLSGGERQRLGLARALVRSPSLLVLDEATSALDAESERTVISALRGLHGAITVIMVSHRLSTVRHADVIFVLEAGEVVERGTWDELIGREGRFAMLWGIQAEGH